MIYFFDLLLTQILATLNNNDLHSIIQGCIALKRDCQKAFYSRYYGFAAAICMRYANTKDDMIEIVNDGFINIFKELHSFKPVFEDEEISLKGWIKRIMINTSIDYHRKYHKQQLMSGSPNETVIEKIEYKSENALDKLSYEEIMKKVKSLSPVYRTVFNLHVIDGLTHEEIAAQLGISVGTSKSNLFKAKVNLKKMLETKNSIVYE